MPLEDPNVSVSTEAAAHSLIKMSENNTDDEAHSESETRSTELERMCIDSQLTAESSAKL